MEYLRLAGALTLPWLGGYFWLAALERKFSREQPNTLRQIGYGLFLGFAGLQAAVLAQVKLFDTVSYWPILISLAVISGAGGVLFFRTTSPAAYISNTHSSPITSPRLGQVLFWFFTAWAILHLVLVAVEIIYRPIFAWDAWLSWMYRAKAWFYAGTILPMDAPAEWLRGNVTSLYNVGGNHYPTFPSLMALWSATALGRWSDTLVNQPVLLCGIALALAMYGQCREAGMPRWLSALGIYLLLSVPLVGTHLSLAGGADVWMMGFTGLGFLALLSGIARGNHFQVLLGLGMTALAIGVKSEGLVWLLAALLTLALSYWPRASAVALGAGVSIIAIAFFAGIHYVELPGLGGLGIIDNRLHIPLLGNYAVMDFDLLDDYSTNFFVKGTWHLLWTLVGMCTLSLLLMPAGAKRRAIIGFFITLFLTQAAIFKGTAAGQWAEQWTAINRLPLHFAPALVFCLLLVAQQFLPGHNYSPANKLAKRVSAKYFVAPAIGLMITLAALLAYLVIDQPTTNTSSRMFYANDMQIVVGSGYVEGDTGVISQFSNNVAILSSGSIYLDADKLEALHVATSGENQASGRFFWRSKDKPDDLQSIDIGGRGEERVNLARSPQWQGIITEIGLLLKEDKGKAVEFTALRIAPLTLDQQLQILWQDWRETSTWSQKSINHTWMGDEIAMVPLPLVMAGWLLATAVTALILLRIMPSPAIAIVVCAIAAWLVLDIRWTNNRLAQAGSTMAYYRSTPSTHLNILNDLALMKLAVTTRQHIANAKKAVFILAESPKYAFSAERLKYHLLPNPGFASSGPLSSTPQLPLEHIVVIRQYPLAPGEQHTEAIEYSNALSQRMGRPFIVVEDTQTGVYLRAASVMSSESPQPAR
jgi:hypothetical protein